MRSNRNNLRYKRDCG